MQFLPNCGYVWTTVWMHHLDAWRKNLMGTTQNAMCYFEQILEAATHKTAAVSPLASHHTNHPSKLNTVLLATAREAETNSLVMFSYGFLHMDVSVLANLQGFTYTSSIWTPDAI